MGTRCVRISVCWKLGSVAYHCRLHFVAYNLTLHFIPIIRYNSSVSECTGLHDTGYVFTVHDVCLLLTRFATEKSFSAETGGGGRDSNMKFIPYIISIALYVINTLVMLICVGHSLNVYLTLCRTRAAPSLDRLLTSFLEAPSEKWMATAYEVSR